MSAPPVPSLAASIGTVFRLQVLRTIRGRKLILGGGALVIVTLVILVTRFLAKDADPATVVKSGIDLGFLHLLVYLLPFLFGSGVIAEEVEGRTFVFLAGRPAGRAAIALGKYLAAFALSAGLLVAGILVLHLIALAGTPGKLGEAFPDTLRAMGAILLLDAAYTAICLTWGALAVEAAGAVSALYLFVIEFGGGLLPGVFRVISLNYETAQLAGFDKGGIMPDSVPDVQPGIAAAVVAVVALLFLFLGVLTVQTSEYRFAKA